MAVEYREYLAARVLTESRPVTYRLLSRAVQVNVSTAKQMLYEFHTTQNARKPKSVHATYLLAGRKRSPEQANGTNGRDGNDVFMSSPYMSSMPDPEPEQPIQAAIPTTTIELVKEEDLESRKAEFEEISSIHVYSLEAAPLENLNVLAVCNHEVATEYSKDDPLQRWRLYGSIHNPYIKRRTNKSAPPATAPAAPKAAPKAAAKTAAVAAPEKKAAPAKKVNPFEPKAQPTSAANTLKKPDSKPDLKKGKSDIFKSFAKAKPKAKEAEKPKPAPAEDEPMQGMSEDEGDADDTPQVRVDQEKVKEARKARADREEALRRMMEESDEEMPDVSPVEEKESPDAAIDKAPPAAAPQNNAAITVVDGRRRGKRKVMVKKKVKDEEGYLVTKEEAVWESFSEDEPQPKKSKPLPKPATTAKGKKTGMTGQGSIASFFKKA